MKLKLFFLSLICLSLHISEVYAENEDKLSELILRSNKETTSELALKILREGIPFENTVNDSVKAAFYQKMGMHYGLVFKIDSSKYYLNKAKTIVDKEGDWGLLGLEVYNSLGNINRGLTNNEEAIEYFNQALSHLGDKKDSVYYINESRIIGNIAGIYYDMQRFDEALKYATKSYEISEKHNLKSRFFISNLIMAFATRAAGKLDEAVKYNKNVIDLIKVDPSLTYYKPHSYYNVASIYLEQENLKDARLNFNEALNAAKAISEYEVETSCLISLANISNQENKLNEAIGYLNDAQRLSVENEFTHKMVEILELKVSVLQKLNKYKEAFDSQSLLLALNDSLKNVSTSAKIDEINTKYETEKKEQQIAQLEKENQLKELEATQQRQFQIFLVVVSLLLIVAIGLLYSRYRFKNETNKKLTDLNYTKDRLFSIISHDLKSPLSSFHTITKSLTENWERIDKEQLKSYIENLRDSSKEVHDMMDNLLRWALSQTGQLNYNPQVVKADEIIEDILRQLQSAVNAHDLTIKKNYLSTNGLVADVDYLKIILRNLVSNAIKFSERGKSIDLIVEENEIGHILSVRDYGVGMQNDDIELILNGSGSVHDIKNSENKGTGLGLTLSKELVKKMGGYIEIESEINQGTTFKLVFPKS